MSTQLNATDKLALIQIEFEYESMSNGIKILSSYSISVKRNLPLTSFHNDVFTCSGKVGFESEIGKFTNDLMMNHRYTFVKDNEEDVICMKNKAESEILALIKADKSQLNKALSKLQSLEDSLTR